MKPIETFGDMNPIETFYASRFALKEVIQRGNKKYVVSTVKLPGSFFGSDSGYETMIFEANEDGTVNNYRELYCDRYESEEEAAKGHVHALSLSEESFYNYLEE